MVLRVLHIGPQQHVAIKALVRREMLNICNKNTRVGDVFREVATWRKSRDERGRYRRPQCPADARAAAGLTRLMSRSVIGTNTAAKIAQLKKMSI